VNSRDQIDRIDDAIVDLLARRAAIVAELWERKRAAGVAIRDPERERAIVERLRARASAAGLDPEAVEGVFRGIIGRDLRER
jgi:chorismate mutase